MATAPRSARPLVATTLVALVTHAACVADLLGGELSLSDEERAVRAMRADTTPSTLVEPQLLGGIFAAGAAAELSGADEFVTTGTVDLRGEEPSYRASPDDELVLREDDHDTRYRIERIAISDVADLSLILLNDHEVRLRAIREDAFDLDLVSERADDQLERNAEGIFGDDGLTYELELEERGASSSEVDGELARYESSNRRECRVTADGLALTVEEDEDYLVIVSEHAFENRSTTVSIDGEVAGQTVRMDEGRVRRSFEDGAPAEPEFWAETTGELEVDGEVVGELAFETEGAAYRVVLKLQGDDEVLESWRP